MVQLGSDGIASTLGLNISPFAAGMMQASAIASIFPSTVQSFMANPLLGIIDLTKQVASAIASMVSDSAREVDAMGKAARNLNVDLGELSTLDRIASLEGVSGFSDALRFLAKNAAEAKGGSGEAAEAFRSLGVTLTDASGAVRPVTDLLMDVADGFAGVTDANLRTNMAMSLLGRSGGEMVGFLSLGSAQIRRMKDEVNPLGSVVGRASYEAAARFNDLKDTIGFAWQDIKLMLAEEITPALADGLQSVLASIRSGGPQIRSIISDIASSAINGVVLATQGVSLLIGYSQELLTIWLAIKGAMAGASVGGLFGPVGSIVGGIIGGGAGLAGGAAMGGSIETNLAPLQVAMDRFVAGVQTSLERGGQRIGNDAATAMYRGYQSVADRQNAMFERAAMEGRI